MRQLCLNSSFLPATCSSFAWLQVFFLQSAPALLELYWSAATCSGLKKHVMAVGRLLPIAETFWLQS